MLSCLTMLTICLVLVCCHPGFLRCMSLNISWKTAAAERSIVHLLHWRHSSERCGQNKLSSRVAKMLTTWSIVLAVKFGLNVKMWSRKQRTRFWMLPFLTGLPALFPLNVRHSRNFGITPSWSVQNRLMKKMTPHLLLRTWSARRWWLVLNIASWKSRRPHTATTTTTKRFYGTAGNCLHPHCKHEKSSCTDGEASCAVAHPKQDTPSVSKRSLHFVAGDVSQDSRRL